MLSRFYDYYINFPLKCHKKPAQIKSIVEWSHLSPHFFFHFFLFCFWWWSRKMRTSRGGRRGKFGWGNQNVRHMSRLWANIQISVHWTSVTQLIKLLRHDLWPSHGSHTQFGPRIKCKSKCCRVLSRFSQSAVYSCSLWIMKVPFFGGLCGFQCVGHACWP